MRKHGSFAALGLVVIALAGGGSLVNGATLEKGTVELTPAVSFSHNSFSFSGNDAGSTTILTGSGILGYCITNNFEVLGGLLVDYFSDDSPSGPSESATSLGLLGGIQYNFSSGGQTIPYARGAIGILTNSGQLAFGDQTTILAPIFQVGMRVLVGSTASVNFGVGYQHRSDVLGVQDLSSNTFDIEVGVSIFPGR